VEVPLSAAIFTTVTITAYDTIRRSTLSPTIIAVILLTLFHVGYRYFLSTEYADITTEAGSFFHHVSLRCFSISSYIYIFTNMIMLQNRGTIAVFESMVLIPLWLSLFLAHSSTETIKMLTLHFLMHMFMVDLVDYWAKLASLLMMYGVLVIIAWTREQLIEIVRQLVNTQRELIVEQSGLQEKLQEYHCQCVERKDLLVSSEVELLEMRMHLDEFHRITVCAIDLAVEGTLP
jgi:hypothetical protein